ncbi:MAG: hypothetical protein U9N59_15680 [Campylobacterota bacterium]|nr:hypothetical protein [Campylobacterota bacterium]
MTRINPILILTLSVVIFIISFSSLHKNQQQLSSEIDNFNSLIVIANKYKGLKKEWDTKNIEAKVKKIARLSNIKNISFSDKKKIIKITIKDEKIHSVDRFINKVLNDNFIIKKLNITKDTTIVEIGK